MEIAAAHLSNFLSSAPDQLAPHPSQCADVDFTYCSLALPPSGDEVSCIRWLGAYYMTGTDVVKVLAFRLRSSGVPLPEHKLLKRDVVSRLRPIKAGRGMLLEPTNHDLVATRKVQKLFSWYAVPHDQLFDLAVASQLANCGPPLRTARGAVNGTAIPLGSRQGTLVGSL
ncbi:hypothetical protein JCM8202_000106 [Rhodotorula sphaerocarpa]